MAQLMPLPLTVCCFSKIKICFTFLAPAHSGSPGKMGRYTCVVAVAISNSDVVDFTNNLYGHSTTATL